MHYLPAGALSVEGPLNVMYCSVSCVPREGVDWIRIALGKQNQRTAYNRSLNMLFTGFLRPEIQYKLQSREEHLPKPGNIGALMLSSISALKSPRFVFTSLDTIIRIRACPRERRDLLSSCQPGVT